MILAMQRRAGRQALWSLVHGRSYRPPTDRPPMPALKKKPADGAAVDVKAAMAARAAKLAAAAEAEAGAAAPEPEPAPAGGGGGGGDPVRKALLGELEKAKAKWGEQIDIVKGGKGEPWPVFVTRTVPQPESKTAQVWDVFELPITLAVEGNDFAALPVAVTVPTDDFPVELKAAIAEAVERKWKATLKDPRAKGKGWLIEMMFKQVEKTWVDLVGMVPECVDSYQTVAEDGSTYQRKVVVIRQKEEQIDPELLAAQKAEEEAEEARAELLHMQKKYAEEEKAIEEKEKKALKARAEAEAGVFEDGKPTFSPPPWAACRMLPGARLGSLLRGCRAPVRAAAAAPRTLRWVLALA
jgi:hypothetical protein